MNNQSDSEYLSNLLALIDRHFDEEELRTLSFKLGVSYESLPAQGKKNKARELIQYMERHAQSPKLIDSLKLERPDVDWWSVFQLSTETSEFIRQEFSSQPFAALVTKAGPTKGSWLFFTEQTRRVIVGRISDFATHDLQMSQQHFAMIVSLIENPKLKKRTYQVELLDLGSSNGTFVNGKHVNRIALKPGYFIQAGGSQFVFIELPTNY